MKIAVDFDGTIVEHRYPAIGKEKPFAIDTLKQLALEGNELILWTSRDGQLLQDAIDYCHKRGLDFYGINSNRPVGSLFEGRTGSTSVKVVADVYIDDKNLGGLPDWCTIYEMIMLKKAQKHRKRSFWKRLFGKRH